tara:strand:+ start:1861 stop:2115 length:255 start_codon:yes stop_codon:yes gene_type:complete
MKKLLMGMLLASFMIAAESSEVGTFQVSTTVVESQKSGKHYVIETIINTKTGEIVARRKILQSKYKLPTKDRYNKKVKSIKLEH